MKRLMMALVVLALVATATTTFSELKKAYKDKKPKAEQVKKQTS